MKNLFTRISLIFAMLLFLSAPLAAQTAVTSTTLSAAATRTATQVSLTSATNVTAGSGIFVDRELMQVVSISGTTAQVIRGVDGTLAVAHASGATAYVGPTSGTAGPGPFWQSDPPIGYCLSTDEQYTLRINTNSGLIWSCINSRWATVNLTTPTGVGLFSGVGATIASAATIAPTSEVHLVSGTTNVVNITVPTGCNLGCRVTLIPTGLWSTTNAGNIAIATTGVVSKALILTYNPATSKWYPSY